MTDLWPGIATSRRPVEARLPLALPPDVSPITATGARVQELAGPSTTFRPGVVATADVGPVNDGSRSFTSYSASCPATSGAESMALTLQVTAGSQVLHRDGSAAESMIY